MANVKNNLLYAAISKRLQAEIASIKEQLASGVPSDYAQYREEVGKCTAFLQAEGLVEDAVKRYIDEAFGED